MPEPRAYLTDEAASALIGTALDRLFVAEHDLSPGASESIWASHLSRHLQDILDERPAGAKRWSVDFGYNRLGEGDDPKWIATLVHMLESLAGQLGWSVQTFVGSKTGKVIPDLVVHRRRSGRGIGNLIACEVKRVGASKQAIAVDLVKLAAYRSDLGYEHAFLILLGETRDACVVHRASTSLHDIAWYVQRLDEAAAIRRMRRGYVLAAQRQRESLAEDGAQPEIAVAESLAALNALDAMSMWPAPRDPISEQGIQQVRQRWAKVQRRAKQARQR